MADSSEGFQEPVRDVVTRGARHRLAEEAEMTDRVGAELGRRQVQPLDGSLGIVGTQSLDRAQRRDGIVNEAHPADGTDHVVVVRAQGTTVRVANVVRRAPPARPAPGNIGGGSFPAAPPTGEARRWPAWLPRPHGTPR